MPFYAVSFLAGRVSLLYTIENRKKGYPYSNLSTRGPRWKSCSPAGLARDSSKTDVKTLDSALMCMLAWAQTRSRFQGTVWGSSQRGFLLTSRKVPFLRYPFLRAGELEQVTQPNRTLRRHLRSIHRSLETYALVDSWFKARRILGYSPSAFCPL